MVVPLRKRTSTIRKENYQRLLQEFKEKDSMFYLSNAKTYKGIQYFCMYLANYTNIKDISEIDQASVENFLKHLMNNQKRFDMSLADIKKTLTVIHEVTKVSSSNQIFDFSLSNLSLWAKLK